MSRGLTWTDLSVEVEPDERTSRNVRGTQTVLTAAAAAGVSRVVLLSSAMVYGAHPDNLVPLPEDSQLRASSDIGLLADLLEIERLGAVAPLSHPGMEVTMVRPATIVGANADTSLTRHFEAPRLLVLRGSRPRWQFCHVDDLASALACAAVGEVTGIVTVRSDGWLEQDDLERISGLHRIELPSQWHSAQPNGCNRLGILPAPGHRDVVRRPSPGSSRRGAAVCRLASRPRQRGLPAHAPRRGRGPARRRVPAGGPPRCDPRRGGSGRRGGCLCGHGCSGTSRATSAAGVSMADVIRLLAVRDVPLSVDEVLSAVADDAAGGTVLFVGTVRTKTVAAVATSAIGARSGEAVLRSSGQNVASTSRARAGSGARVGDPSIGE